ncbi:IS630 family transposase, partial [Azoarcus communis]
PIAKTSTALLEKARTCMARIAAMHDLVQPYFKHEQVRYAS